MEDKYNWYSIGFLVTKEEVIALRTLYLEFGDEETKKTRLGLPYENIEIDEGCEGYHAIDLFSILLFYQFSNKFEKPVI